MTDSDANEPPRPADGTTPHPESKRDAHSSADQLTMPFPAPNPAASAGHSTFFANDLLADRYRILRFVAQGGMGEVYEAEDLTLHEHVALKTIRPEIARDPVTLHRFKREIHLARKVTHANVCRIFDVGHHGTAADPTIFLTMELLAGETLAERIGRGGPMQPAEALPLVRQMAAALEAAHAQGIVHRDFKSSNVVLVGATEALRAVVTDFGLARGNAATDSFAASVFGASDVVGTPAYMAPEQVEGGTIGPAADIYALGVVMFEMMTGEWPFVGDSSLSTAVKRLKEPAPSPRIHVPDLDRRWETAILRCVERDPADRFASVWDVVRALGGEEVKAGRKEKRLLRQRLAIAGAAVLLLLAAGITYHVSVTRELEQQTASASAAAPDSLPAPPRALRRSIAVLGFKNLSGKQDAAWLSTALSEMLGSELSAGQSLRVVSGEDVARMKTDLALADTDSLATDTLGRIRAHSQSDFVVLGSYFATGGKSGGKIRLDLKVQDTSGEGILASFIGNGTEADLSELVSGTAAGLREKLDLEKILPADARAIKASAPQTPEALRHYSEGLSRLRSFDALGARDSLEKAVAADPNHALAHSALASVWSSLGYDQKGKDEATRAFDLSAKLPREDRVLVQGRYHEAMKKWDEAIEAYRTLWTFAPDSLDYGLRLASAQTSGGKPKDALLVTETLRKLPPPASDDPRIDLAEAAAADSLGDFRQTLAAAERAAEKGKQSALRLVVARASILGGGALRKLGELPKARSAAEEAREIYAATGDQGGVANALNIIANVLLDHGDFAGAKKMYEKSLAIRRDIGDQSGVASSLNNIAIVLKDQGDLAGAKHMYAQSLTIRREIGNKSGVASSLNNIAIVLHDQGDLAGAKTMYEESLAIKREIGDKRGVANSLNNIAIVLAHQGSLSAAKTMHEESLVIKREIGNKSGVSSSLNNIAFVLSEQGDLAGAKKSAGEALAVVRKIGQKSESGYALEALANVFEAEGDLPSARRHHQEALDIRQALGAKLTAAASRLELAELSIEEERPGEAAEAAREVASFFQKEDDWDSEAGARAILARALLEARDVDSARKEIARAESLMRESQKAMTRASIGVTSARIRAASGKPADVAAARKGLESFLAEATKNGWVASALAIRLTLGEIEMRSDPAAGRARLAGLERDARARGFGLMARQAAKLGAGAHPSPRSGPIVPKLPSGTISMPRSMPRS